MSLPGFWEILLIVFIVVLLFGARRIPALFGAVGEGVKNFKKGIKDDDASGSSPKGPPRIEPK